ncbi:MAG: hypothetical protein HZA50_07500 [Planctomycetes bacterium]|nr:hypothetical protein [Planctomycetota bacterium]
MDRPSDIKWQTPQPAGAESPGPARAGDVSRFAKIVLLAWMAGIMAISFLIYSGTLLGKIGLNFPMLKRVEDGLSAFFS